MCTYPRAVKNSKGIFNVPCGHCYQCLQQRRNTWTLRNLVEQFHSKSSYFLTLTYSDEGIKSLPLCSDTFIRLSDKSHYQKFLKRLRKDLEPLKLRYFGCHEYGKKYFRPHYHIIIYLDQDKDIKPSDIQQFWTYGIVTVDPLNQARIHYCSKYLQKPFRFEYFKGLPKLWLDEEEAKNGKKSAFDKLVRYTYRKNTFNFMSRRPGIGYQLMSPEFVDFVRRNSSDNYTQITYNGQKFPLPKFFKDKIFTEEEKQLIYPKIKSELEHKDAQERKYYKLTRYQIMMMKHRQNLNKLNNIRFVSSGEVF